MSGDLKNQSKTVSAEVKEVSMETSTAFPKPDLKGAARELVSEGKEADKHLYLTGLRGILVVQSFLWTFFQTFIPTLASSSTPGPGYQAILRDILSVPLWNPSLIYNFFILLSMRTICVSFLQNPTGQTYAATMIRRIVRMVIIMTIGSGMATLIFSQIGVDFIDEFKSKLPNHTIHTPVQATSALVAWNSLFDLFWLTANFFHQAANSFWPTHTLWAPAIIYFQSFTVYFLMVILPFTRAKWHLQGLGLFALGSFWMESWGWYSATGLFLADLAINDRLKSSFKAGIKITDDHRIPYWIVAAIFAAIGIALKYTFVVLPQYTDRILVIHPYLDLSENYSPESFAGSGPYPRIDDWLVAVGILVVVEFFQRAQDALSYQPLIWLGERSFSIFVAQSIVFWTGGIKLWLALTEKSGLSVAGANAVVLIACFAAIAIFAELFYRAFDRPSTWIAKKTYIWLVN